MYNYELKYSHRPFQSSKCCVVLPCKNRAHHLALSLPRWLEQTYKNTEIVVVDYSSDEPVFPTVQRIAREYNTKAVLDPPFDWRRMATFEKISVLRIEGREKFNMGHACNYGIRHSCSDVVQVSGCDSLPLPHYLDVAMHSIDHESFTMRPVGRMCFPKSFWWRVNGYQEFCDGWGAEDYDYGTRMAQNSRVVQFDYRWIASVYHGEEDRTQHYSTENKHVSNVRNFDRCKEYFDRFGPIANYNLLPGNAEPIAYRDVQDGIIRYVVAPSGCKADFITKRSSLASSFQHLDKTFYCCFLPNVEENVSEPIFADEIKGDAYTISVQNPSVNSILMKMQQIVTQHYEQLTNPKLI